MGSAAQFVAQFFPLFLLGALFGKLMDDSGSVQAIARSMSERLGSRRAILAVVLAGAIVTYGGVSLFVAFFVLAPMAAGAVPRRGYPAPADARGDRVGHLHFHHVGASRNALHPERNPDAVFRHHAIRRARPRHHRVAIMLGFGLWWLGAPRPSLGDPARAIGGDRRNLRCRRRRPVHPRARHTPHASSIPPKFLMAITATRRHRSSLAVLPLIVVVSVNLLMSLVILPRLDFSFLAEERWGATSLSAVGGVWAVAVALAAATATLVIVNYRRLPALRESMDAGANASVLPVLSVASLVGFGAVVAALPAFEFVRDWVLSIGGGPLVSLAVATNMLAALTGSASGGLTIALDALGGTYMSLAAEHGIDPALMHRVAVIGAGTLDSLPHNGAVVTLLAVCGSTHRQSYLDIVIVGDCRRADRPCRGHCAGVGGGIVLRGS